MYEKVKDDQFATRNLVKKQECDGRSSNTCWFCERGCPFFQGHPEAIEDVRQSWSGGSRGTGSDLHF